MKGSSVRQLATPAYNCSHFLGPVGRAWESFTKPLRKRLRARQSDLPVGPAQGTPGAVPPAKEIRQKIFFRHHGLP